MLYDIYRVEMSHLGYTDIIIAWSGASLRSHWGCKVDTVNAQTGRDAADIYFNRTHQVFPWGGMSTLETGVYCVTLNKHASWL